MSSTGGRYALEDDGETPDLQDAMWVFAGPDAKTPGFVILLLIYIIILILALVDFAKRKEEGYQE